MSLSLQYKSLFSVYKRSTYISIGLLGLQALIGINAAKYYGPYMMQETGITFENKSPDVSALILNIPLAFVSLLGTFGNVFMIDRFGRRLIMLATLPPMATFWVMAAVGTAFTGPEASEASASFGGITTIVSLYLFMLAFGLGISSTPWAISAEIFPIHLVGTGNSLAATSNWICNALIAQVFKCVSEVNVVSHVILYAGLGAVAFGTYFFVYYLVPETAGKSIEANLDEIVGKGHHEREQAMLAQER